MRGCYVTIGRRKSSVIFLHGVMGNNTSGDCKMRITGLTKIPSTIVGQTGRVTERLRRRSLASKTGSVVPCKRTRRLDFFERDSRPAVRRPFVTRLERGSLSSVAPLRTLGCLCILRRGLGGRRWFCNRSAVAESGSSQWCYDEEDC